MTRFRVAVASTVLALTAGLCQAGIIWQNTEVIPDDLIATQDGWTAARVNDRGQESWRTSADDFILEKTTRIDKIVFFAVMVGEPVVIGGDWYIFEGSGDVPGELIAHGAGEELDIEDTGWQSNSFGTIYRNTMTPENLELPAGRYFIALRSIMSCPGGCAGKYAMLTTRWANGKTPALWNFGLLENGDVIDRWMLMEEFNLIHDQEWAFILEGGVECDDIKKLKASCKNGKLTAKVKSKLAEGTRLTVDNDGDQRAMVIDRKGKGKVKYKNQSGGAHRVSILDCPEHTRDVECR